MRRWLGVVLLMAAGCSFEPEYRRPQAPIPRQWPQDAAYSGGVGNARPTAWQQLFLHPRLRGVIEKALVYNRDLRVAAGSVRSARAQYALARAGLYPTIAAGADLNLQGNLEGDIVSQMASIAVGTTAYEIDLFGRLRSLKHAALENYLASRVGARAVRLTLIADTASAWLNVATQRSLLAIAQQTQESASESVRVTLSRLEGGVASELDVRQSETIAAQARSDVAAYTTTVAQARNALALLVGRELAQDDMLTELRESEGGLAEIPAGLASTVLLARPDVLQAEHVLQAANANIGAARSAYFPRLTLTALGGFMSNALSSLFTLGGAGWALAPSVTAPIVTWGANDARLESARGVRDQSLASYERVIQRAFREVADALARRGTIEAQLAAQRQLVAASEASYQLSEARYKAGADSYLNALDAQRTLYTARRSLVLTEQSRADNLVTLYRVLGGGG